MRSIMRIATAFCLLSGVAHAQSELTSEACATALQRATVTVRVRLHPDVKEKESEPEDAESIKATAHVTICSGVAVTDKLVVTTAFAAADSQIRLTLPGGQQREARLRVFDEFSGLALLESKEGHLQALPFGAEKPPVGAWVMGSAAWGAEQPLISVGVVGGIDRSIKGCVYPPLLQCDIRPAETSSGAGLVDRHGNLVGVIVAGDGPEVTRGWMYAVPVSHVQRLLRARVENAKDDSVVVLKRRRPTIGCTFLGSEAGVAVTRVNPDSPAEKAGIQVGDRIVSVDGLKVRAAYDAGRPSLYKQPGDTMVFEVERKGETKKFEIVLGGGVELPGATLNVLGQLVAPKIEVNLRPATASPAKPFAVEINAPYAVPSEKDVASQEKVKLLEKAMDRYRSVIEQQQKELSLRDQERRQQAETIELLKSELDGLKKASR